MRSLATRLAPPVPLAQVEAELGLKLRLAWSTLRHHAALRTFARAGGASALGRLLEARPTLWGVVVTPFVSTTWSVATRVARIAGHCAIMDELGHPFDLPPHGYVELLDLPEIHAALRVTLDSPAWLVRDGLLTLSLWYGVDRILSLSFTLGDVDGARTAFIGGLQGARLADDSIYRDLTKQAEGLRPRDLLLILFQALARQLGVAHVLAVSSATRHQRSPHSLARAKGVDPVEMNYDAIWEDRGGVDGQDGFFALPLESARRADADIPARKRAMYRRRYALLDTIERALAERLADPGAIELKHHAQGHRPARFRRGRPPRPMLRSVTTRYPYGV